MNRLNFKLKRLNNPCDWYILRGAGKVAAAANEHDYGTFHLLTRGQIDDIADTYKSDDYALINIFGASMSVRMRNTGNMDIYATVYWLVPRSLLDGNSAPRTLLSGDIQTVYSGITDIENDAVLHPFVFKQFTDKWFCYKKRSVRFHAGQERTFMIKNKRQFQHNQLSYTFTANEDVFIPRVTRTLFWEVHGPVVHDSTNEDQCLQGPACLDAIMTTKVRFSIEESKRADIFKAGGWGTLTNNPEGVINLEMAEGKEVDQ